MNELEPHKLEVRALKQPPSMRASSTRGARSVRSWEARYQGSDPGVLAIVNFLVESRGVGERPNDRRILHVDTFMQRDGYSGSSGRVEWAL